MLRGHVYPHFCIPSSVAHTQWMAGDDVDDLFARDMLTMNTHRKAPAQVTLDDQNVERTEGP